MKKGYTFVQATIANNRLHSFVYLTKKIIMRSCSKFMLCFSLNIVLFISAYTQHQNKIDSLINVLKTAVEDTNKVNLLNALCKQVVQTSNYLEAKKYANEALHLSEKINFKKGVANAYNNFGVISWYEGNYSEALKFHSSALKLRLEINDKQGIANSYNNLALIYSDQGNYPEALKNHFASLRIYEELNDRIGLARSYNNLGEIYRNQNSNQDALKYYRASLKIKEEFNDKTGISNAHNNIGLIYRTEGLYPEALENLSASLKIRMEIGDKLGISACYNNIANTYCDLGKYSKALEDYFASLKIKEEIGDRKGIAMTYNNIGGAYTSQKNFTKALQNLNKGLFLSKEMGAKDWIRDSYYGLSELDSVMGNYKQSLEHYKLYLFYKDSILNETENNRTAQMKIQYETQKKDKEISLLNKDKEIQNIEIKKQTLLKNSLIFGLAFTLLLFFLAYKNYHTRQKLKLENIRNNIAADLHDDIGSTLNSISLFSEVAKQEAGKQIPALDQIGVSARKIIDAMSDIVWTINPENDTFENVIARMRSLAYLLLKAKGIEFSFKADENLNDLSLPMTVRKNIFLLFKEATNNLVKYSSATRASFFISFENKNVKMIIRDNGAGFDIENAKMGNGIKNMKRRAAEISAQLLIESAEGKGTNIELSFKA
jgi:two-component system sensor histidine kinase UhpB